MFERTCSGHLYDVLELPRDCSDDDVRRAYHRLALRFHPDKTGGTTTERFKEIEEANRVLRDVEQRRLYDMFGRSGMATVDRFSIPQWLLSASILRAALMVLGTVFGVLLLQLVLLCVKVDYRLHGPGWAWGVVMLPIWVLLPLVALVGVGITVAALRGGASPDDDAGASREEAGESGHNSRSGGSKGSKVAATIIMLTVGVELLYAVVLLPVTGAALSGRPGVSTVAVAALWTGWLALRALRRLLLLWPPVFAVERQRENAYAASAAAAAAAAGGDPSAASAAAAREYEDGALFHADAPAPSLRSVCMSRVYVRELALEALYLVCLFSFVGLVFARCRQASGGGGGSVGDRRHVLSFWTIFAPLIVYHGGITLLAMVEGFFTAKAPPPAPSEGYAAFDDGVNGGAAPSSAGGGSSPSLCGRVCSGVLAAVPPGLVLYMILLSAPKSNYLFNQWWYSWNPSAFVVTLPVLVPLVLMTLLPCCAGCMISRMVRETLASQVHAEGGGGGGGTSAAAAGPAAAQDYDSTGHRETTTTTTASSTAGATTRVAFGEPGKMKNTHDID